MAMNIEPIMKLYKPTKNNKYTYTFVGVAPFRIPYRRVLTK